MGMDVPPRHLKPVITDPSIWKERVQETYVPVDVISGEDVFQGDLKRMEFGPLSLIHSYSTAVRYECTRSHVSRQARNFSVLAIPTARSVTVIQRGREMEFKAGEMFVIPVGEPFICAKPDKTGMVALIADTPLLRDHLPNIEDYWGLGFCMFRGLGRVAWDVLCSAMVRLHELTDKETDLIARHVIDLLSSVMRNDERTLRIGSSVARSTHLHRIEKYICAHYDKPDLSAAAIARDCGISLRYLHQIFVGTDRSVGQYIRRRRLLEAQRLLKERGELKLADIAYRCGFSDHTALSRYFKREIGITPSEYRAMSGSKALPGYRALSPDHPRSS